MVEVVDPSDQHVDAGLHVGLCDVIPRHLLACAIEQDLKALHFVGMPLENPADEGEDR